MAEPRKPAPVLLIVAAFSRHPEALVWARARLQETLGPVALVSPAYDFNQTAYYEATMGPALRKEFVVFRDCVPPDCLPQAKLATNALEEELARARAYAEPRPLNLDPGLLSLGKFS